MRKCVVRFSALATLAITLCPRTLEAQVTGGPYQLYSVLPCRILDTRSPGPDFGVLYHGAVRNFQVNGRCSVPSDAKAAALNIVVISPTSEGHLVVWPYNTSMPAVSNMNYWAGAILANGAVMSLTPNPTFPYPNISVMPGMIGSGHNLHLIIDVTGYWQ